MIEPHENVAVIHFLQKITHFAHILQLDRQLYAPKTLHETPLRSFCPNFRSLDIASAIMYGRHLEYRISQSLRNLTHSHHTTRATGDESGTVPSTVPPPSGEKFEMFVDIRRPIRVECILSCSTTSAFCPANPARGYILAEFCYSLTDFRANLSSLTKASLF